jgi:sterol desaturase/sphingolipid hydroxylase (fatty acid hydroxylase superfamily)
MRSVKRLLPWIHYPLVMIAVFALFAWLQSQGGSLIVSTYVPVLFAAATVTVLELAFPNRTAWRPPAAEIRTALVFMTAIQLALPPLVGFLFLYLLIEPARALDLPVTGLWPHGWPIWIQAILMVLTVDLLRYWLHRFAHQNDTLWRLHSVHHSVEQL